MALGLQQALLGGTTGEVGHRQVEEGDQPAQQVLQRHVFTKRHQLLLEVVAAALADHADAVVVALLAALITLANRHAGDQRGISLIGEAIDHAQVTLSAVLEHRDCSFRPDDQVGRFGAEGHVAVQRQLRVKLLGVPLHVLFDIALHGRHAQRFALWLGPGVILEGKTGDPWRD